MKGLYIKMRLKSQRPGKGPARLVVTLCMDNVMNHYLKSKYFTKIN